MRSIALPLLGTGVLNSPPDEVARIMLEEIALFSKTNTTTALGDVSVVLLRRERTKIDVSETPVS